MIETTNNNIFEHFKPMHMKRINLGLNKLWLVAFLCLMSSASLMAQTVKFSISGTGNAYEGCEDYLVTFAADISGSVDSVELWYGGARVIRHDDWQKNGNIWSLARFLSAGTYNPILKVKVGGVWKDYLLTQPIKVYTNPVAEYEIITDTSQCFKGNEFCFESRAQTGTEGHKIVNHNYDVGDGNLFRKDKFCHSYAQQGDFDIVYTVVDEKGCSDEIVVKEHPEVYKKIGADFRVVGPVGCPCTDIQFNNRTPFDTAQIEFWIWDWGTGGRKAKDTFYMRSPGNADYDNNWTGFKRQYCKDGYSSPKLVVVARDGCRDSIILKDAIRVINFRFDITWVPDTPCFTDNTIRFNMPPRPNATQLLWVFGDPASMNLNVNNESWSPEHVFVGGPGFYNITFQVLEPPCPVRDTVLCFVKLKGPAASINLPGPPFPGNNCVDPREIPKADFERIKYDECYRESADIEELGYVWINSNGKSKRDSYYVYCNAIIDSYMVVPGAAGDGATACGPTFTYAKQEGWVAKDIFQEVYVDPNTPWKVTKEDFRESGILRWLNKGESVEYDATKFTASTSDWYRFFCDSFYFYKGDSIPRNPSVIDSIAIFEPPINGLNGNWRYRMNAYSQSFRPIWEYTDPIPVPDSLQFTDSLMPVGGGSKIYTTFWVYAPYMRAHTVNISGTDYLYRITTSPIKHNNGQYYPPMYPGTQPADCDDEWRQMHDSDKFKFDCKAPNLVSFTNNTSKYRLFGRKRSELPTHAQYDRDNLSMAFTGGPGSKVTYIDSCKDNPNFPWASDSLYYLWDFGDNSDQCTTYYDANREIAVKGQNPSGDPLQCKFSELVAPQHLYTEDGCWTAQLSVYDPVTDCESGASQPIVMEEPDGGPADPLGPLDPTDVNYYNQVQFQKDENNDDFRKGVELGRGAAPCVGNAVNPYFQRINVAATIPLCGRETFWMIFNRDDPHQGENDDLTDNDCIKNECTTDGNGKIVKKIIENRGSLHNSGTYDVEWREVLGNGKWGKTHARGRATISALGYLDKVTVTDQDGGFSNKAKVQMVFSDSSKIGFGPGRDSVIVYGYEQVDTFWYECNWIPEMILQLIGMRWSYTTAGCKTPGIVIKTGDCFDTFFYENYRYFLDANGNFQLSPNPRTMAIEEETIDRDDASRIRQNIVDEVEFTVCKEPSDPSLLPTKLPYKMIMSVEDYERNDPMDAGADPVCDALDSLRSFKYFVAKTADQCGTYVGSQGSLEDSLDLIPDGFEPITGGNITLVNLRDTLHYTIKKPGKYIVSTSARAKHGPNFCFGGASKEIWVGQHQCFRYTDSILCEGQDVTFYDSTYYWHPSGQIFCELANWWDNTTCIDSNAFFYNPDSNTVRKNRYRNGLGKWYEAPDYKEMIAWDFDAPRYVKNPDGTDKLDAFGNKVRMQDWRRTMDSSNIEIWIRPADSIQIWNLPSGVDTVRANPSTIWDSNSYSRPVTWTYGSDPKYGIGKYDVTLWARDSMGCWTPYTKMDAITVLGVEARFTLCDTCTDILICTPAATGFRDSSVILEEGGSRSVTKGANDEIVKWKWKWGDRRDSALIQHPIHTYLDANEKGYTVRLFVETAQGCKDSITMPNFIKILGPKATFDVLLDSVCVLDSIYLIDKTESKTLVQSVWSSDPFSTTVNSFVNKRDTVGFFIDKPGSYTIKLQVAGKVLDPITGVERDCVDQYPNPDASDEKPVTVYVRAPDPININASDLVICPGEEVVFTIKQDSTFENYDTVFWNTGIGNPTDTVLRGAEIKQVYDESGKYRVSLSGTGEWMTCPDKDSVLITVKEVKADVEIEEALSNTDLGNYVFLNNSENALYHRWRVYLYPDTVNAIFEEVRTDTSRLVYNDFINGDYKIELLVSDFADPNDSKACVDVDFVKINVDPLIKVYNIFTPNGDNENDFWEMELQASPEYELFIYNRWGELMMKGTQDDDINCYYKESTSSRVCQFWDGTNRIAGGNAIAGTYFYVFNYRFKGETEDEMKTITGSITLVR